MASRAALLVLALVLAVCGRGAPPPEARDAGRLGRVQLFRPAGPPRALVFLFSDDGGWSAEWTRAAATLREQGAAVVGVDLPAYLAALRASDDGCHYVVAELEAWSQRWQRELGGAAYRSPILAGAGAGGTLALAALAQAPAATVAGAAVADPTPALATRVPLCPGAPSRLVAGGGFAYEEPAAPPGFVLRAGPSAEPAAMRAAALVASAFEAPAGGDGVGALPLVELPISRPSRERPISRPSRERPISRPGRAFAVIFSGDGGWRDLDKTIGERLAEAGVPVVGVDSLRYFWREKTPAGVASDLAGILRHYAEEWQRPQVALIGYSFGAGVLPFAMNRLPPAERARVVQLTLLGLEARAPFAFHVSGWLEQAGLSAVDPYRDAPLVLPELLRIDPRLVQCVYGDEEPDSLCRAPELAGVERIATSGGHHFDGDYPALARRILAGLERRAAERGGP